MYFLLIHLALIICPIVNADKGEVQQKLLGYEDFVIRGQFFHVRINTTEQILNLQDFLDHLSKQIEDNASSIDIVQIIRKRLIVQIIQKGLKFFIKESGLYEPTKCVLYIPSSLKIRPYSNQSIDYISFMDNIIKYTHVISSLLKSCSNHHQELDNSEIFSQTHKFIRFLHLKQISLIIESMNKQEGINPYGRHELQGFENLKLSHITSPSI